MIGVGLRGTEQFVTGFTKMLPRAVTPLMGLQQVFLVKLLTAFVTAKLGTRDNLISFIHIKSICGGFLANFCPLYLD